MKAIWRWLHIGYITALVKTASDDSVDSEVKYRGRFGRARYGLVVSSTSWHKIKANNNLTQPGVK